MNWLNSSLVPLIAEVIIYDKEVDSNGNSLALPSNRTVPYTYPRVKIGDGITAVSDLPFINDNITINGMTIQEMIKLYVDEAILGGEW